MYLVEVTDRIEGWMQVGPEHLTLDDARNAIPMVQDTYSDFEIRIVMIVEEY